jgi:hypothetical protein
MVKKKSMTHLVTFSDDKMTRSKELCVNSAQKHGVDKIYPQNPDTISSEFRLFNPVLNEERGAGYWLWKPYFIYKSMFHCEEGDILIYADAGVEFVDSVKHIVDRMNQDIFFFTNGHKHVEWCKSMVFFAINGEEMYSQPDEYQRYPCDHGVNGGYKNATQVQASVIFFRVNQKTKDFVKQWLMYCQMPGFIDDSPSKQANFSTFAEHRHDQSILTCLQIKHGYKLHFWPTNYSEHIRHTAQPEDNYPTLFNHHRKRNDEW